MEYHAIVFGVTLFAILMSNCVVFIREENDEVSMFLSSNLTDIRWFITSLLVIGITLMSLAGMPLIIVIIGLLMAVNTIYDLKYFLAPDVINALIAVTGILYNLVTYGHLSSLKSGLISCIFIFIVWLVIHYTTNGGVGGGDFKLLMALSFLMGADYLFLMILLAITSVVVLIPYFLIKGKKLNETSIALVPFFLIGYLITYNYGERLINWYGTGFGMGG